MKCLSLRALLAAGVCTGFALVANAQIITLRAALNSAQETTGSTSAATGSAIMMYDVSKNTFDLVVYIDDFANPVTGSHIHEAATGQAGPVVTGIGAETAYTRNGNDLAGTFTNLAYAGDPKTLLQGGAYFNVHSAQFPGGEIRGQLIAQPKKLYANLDVATAQAALAPGTIVNSNAMGAAVMWLDPSTNRLTIRMNIYRFMNTLIASHFHEAVAPANGPVVTGLGDHSAYTDNGGGFFTGTFQVTYGGDPIKLLTGGTYLNAHSDIYKAGEIKGWVKTSEEMPGTRVVNLSARGMVGAGGHVLIGGFRIAGPEPVRVLITAKGPSLAQYGITDALTDPWLELYDVSGHPIAANNDVGTPAAGSDLAMAPGVPSNPLESALLIVLPPGTYTAIVSGNNGATGVALLEATDLRDVEPSLVAR